MSNLPTELKEKIETAAQEWATSGSLKEWIDTGMNDTRFSKTKNSFTAGAQYGLSLQKDMLIGFAEWVDLNAVRNGYHEWTVGAGKEQKDYTSEQLYNLYLDHLNQQK